MNVSRNGVQMLADLLDRTFDIQQGDVNATVINPLRRGIAGRQTPTDIAIYKGDDAHPWAPLPAMPSDWAETVPTHRTPPAQAQRAMQTLAAIHQRTDVEMGMVLRQVARLNTRERLIATWFERDGQHSLAFTNEVWRMAMLPGVASEDGKALLALCMSRTIVYLINLFSTNNHVGKDELRRVPIPSLNTYPRQRLAQSATALLVARLVWLFSISASRTRASARRRLGTPPALNRRKDARFWRQHICRKPNYARVCPIK